MTRVCSKRLKKLWKLLLFFNQLVESPNSQDYDKSHQQIYCKISQNSMIFLSLHDSNVKNDKGNNQILNDSFRTKIICLIGTVHYFTNANITFLELLKT